MYLQRIIASSKIVKDTRKENTPPNKTKALTKRVNMRIWEIGTLNHSLDARVVFKEYSEYVNNDGVVVY